MSEHVPILIAGGGPVGMTLALDLGWRGVPCLVVEETLGAPENPRCNTTAARSMELFRRLGVADRIRAAGLPDDWATDMVYRTRYVGHELVRFVLPTSLLVRSGGGVDEGLWPTPEPQHRISQIFLEPILIEHAAQFPSVRVERGTRLVDFEQNDDRVIAELEDVASGERRIVEADYLVGCDGGRSMVRRGCGIRFEGVDAINEAVSLYFRSREMLDLEDGRSWMSLSFNEDGIGNIIAIDGKELWLNHNIFPAGTDTVGLDPADLLEQTLGTRIQFEQLGLVRWTGRRLVADRYREGRVLLAGDAAHIWIPMAGFGMNAGIHDAAGLAWMLSAVHHGWAGADLLDAYEAERRPVGNQIGRAAQTIAVDLFGIEERSHVEDPGEKGERARADLAKLILSGDHKQFNPVGLNFGYHYGGSPLVFSEDPGPAPLEIDVYEPTACPGCRLPHFWRAPGVSIFDQLGPDFTLLRVGDGAPSAGSIVDAFAVRGVPLEVLWLEEPEVVDLYGAKLVLVRPDQHVAWRGDEEPDDPAALADRVRGAAPATVLEAAEATP